MNDTFAQCARNVFNGANSSSALFENENDDRMLSNSTITKHLEIKTSSLQENIFIAVEDIYTQVLAECCNCTKYNYYNNANNIKCDTATISDFISQLVAFFRNAAERNTTATFDITDRVR